MNIMVCYDGSEVAKEGLKIAKTHAKSFSGKLHLVRSMEGGPDVPKKDFDDAERELNELAQAAKLHDGIQCEPHLLVRGMAPGEDLVQFATEQQINEIVIGIRKRSKVGKLLFGSTAQYVILEAPCPVLSIR
jgi:nucleotide-binding universal stress UspA family protein